MPGEHELRRDVPEDVALARLRRIADPAFWTWDAVVVRAGGDHASRYVGTSKVATSDQRIMAALDQIRAYEE